MKTYEKTHNFINFKIDLSRASHELWLQLGEIKSKCEHIAGVPLMPATAQELYKVFLAKGALATTAIEGNTLTEEQVQKHLNGQLELPLSQEYLKKEVDNIIAACDKIENDILINKETKLSVEKIKKYNKWVLEDLPLEEGVIPGEVRMHSVTVGNYRGAPAKNCEALMGKLCNWLNNEVVAPRKEEEIVYGVLKAIICHIYIAWIHPFGDGNGRTARLLEMEILLSAGVPAPSVLLLSNHYNQTRSQYYRELNDTHRSGGNLLPFIQYAMQGLIDGLKEQLDYIRGQQLHVHWIDYVHSRFTNKDSVTQVRRRRLIIDLSSYLTPIPAKEVKYISPRMVEAYSNLTDKTISRDINALIKEGLILRTSSGLIANKEIILAFLPPRMKDKS